MRSRLVGLRVGHVAVVLLSLVTVAPTTAAWAQVEVFDPATIHYPGSSVTSARGINNRGDVVGTFGCPALPATCINPLTGESSTPGTHGFLLRDGVYTRIDVPGGVATIPRGVSQQGVVVGHYTAAGVTHGFTYANGQHVYPIDVPAELFDNPTGQRPKHTLPVRMSPQGDIVGCIHEGNDTMTTMHGWLWRNGRFTILATPFGQTARDPDTMNNGIAATGQIVGFYFADGVSYVADQTGVTRTFTVGGDRFTLAWDVNARGDIVGVVGDNQSMTRGFAVRPRGFLVSNDGDERIFDVRDATNTQFIGINDKGDVVGQYTDSTGTHGFVYRVPRRSN